MKIGVITTHYASNYGALLQTYALQKFLNTFPNVEAEVIAYNPPHAQNYWRVLPSSRNWKDVLLNCYLILHPRWLVAKKNRYKQDLKFRDDYIKCSKNYTSRDEFKFIDCIYDAIICGSDQIWNASRHSELEKIWFLDIPFRSGTPVKIAYAPSVAEEIPEDKKTQIAECLKSFSFISVREDVDVERIQELTNVKVEHVCDPVFLLSCEEWEKIEIKPDIDEEYICCYFFNPSEDAVKAVNVLRMKTGLKIVNLNVNTTDKFESDYDIRDAGPRHMVGYIHNAKYVVTNSFHGTAFSIIFNKRFVVIPKHTANSRMQSLLKKVGLEKQFLWNEPNDIWEQIHDVDYSEVQKNISSFRGDSIEFLKNALGSNGDII